MENITVNIDNLTLGDLEKLDGDSFRDLMEVLDHCVIIEGVPPENTREELRKLNWRSLGEIGKEIQAAVNSATNPEVGGKNSIGV
jgi:hypothetical protein